LKKLCEKKLDGLDMAAILMDGIHLGKQVLVVALNIESTRKKQVRRYLFVIDGAQALRAAIERVH